MSEWYRGISRQRPSGSTSIQVPPSRLAVWFYSNQLLQLVRNLVFVMSTTNCVWDGNSQTEQVYDDELDYNNLWEPWKNIVSVKTATANISHLQKIANIKTNKLRLNT